MTMEPNVRWQRVRELFAQAVERPPAERAVFLAQACPDDALRSEVLSLLEAEQGAGRFDRLAADIAPASVDAGDEPTEPAIKRVGPWAILERIAHGGMGSVYLAERADGQFRQRVALKLMRRDMDTDELRHRFLVERQILARLTHASIARLLDGGITEEGRPYFVMEYVEGRRIDEYCDEHRLDIPSRLRLFLTVCDAVQHAHRALVIHRDIKPGNILVAADGSVKLLDFGIAKVLDPEAFPESDRTRTGVRLLTPEYASPEQVRGEAVTTASDVYQLGLLLFQLLAGRRPRLLHAPASPAALRETDRPSAAASAGTKPEEVDTAAATAPSTEEVAAARGTTPDRLRRQLEGDLDNIVAMALREDAARRYASVEQLAEDVRRHLDGLPVRARPETIGYLLSKFVRRHRVGVTASAALVVLAIAFVGSIVIQSRRVARERDRAQQMADLMIGMFTSIEPDVARGDTVTVLELLDRGVERGPRTLSGQPDLQATMLSTLAGVYSELGNPARAESLEEQSLALRRASFGREHPLTIVSLSRLGTFRTLRGDPSGAIPLFEEAEPLARRKFGPRHLETAHVLRGWGFALQVRGDYDAARRHTVEALAIYREQGDTALAELALTLNNLAWLHQVSGQLDSAEIRLRESLAIRRRILEPDHPELATSVAALADLLLRQGKLDEAEPLVNEELSIREKMLGRDHPDYAMSLKHQAWLFNARNDLDSAEQTYRGALDIQRRAYGNDHLAVADGLNQLAIFVKDRRGNPAAAEPLFREAVEINRRVRGDRALATAILRTNLAAALYVQRRYADAEPLYREALPVLDSLRPDDPDNGQVLVDYGEVLRNLGKHAEAEPLLRRALDIELRARSAGDWRILHRQGVLGACLLDQRRFADAEPYLLDSYNALMRERGLSNPFTRIALDRLIQLYTVWNRPAEAQRYRALIANR